MARSIFGKPGEGPEWTPLPLGTLFTEGWFQPWISPPAGSSGAVRQGWINDFQGFYSRDVFGVFTYTGHLAGGGNEQVGQFAVESPLSRRRLLGVYSNFIDSLNDRNNAPNATSYGDTQIIPKIMLAETEDLSLLFGLSVRVPTGEASTGNDKTNLFPFLAVWTDLGAGVAFRGGMGVEVPLNTPASPAPVLQPPTGPTGVTAATPAGPGTPGATMVFNACLGQTLTKHEAAPFGDLTYFVCANLRQDLGAGDRTLVTLTPGVRTHLGHNWFLIGGLEVPVTGPKPFDERATVVLIKGF
jgi:hypothetical protein